MFLRHLLWVGLGSFAGGILRYLVALYTRNHGFDGFFPWGTFLVNVIGCFVMGLLFALSSRFPIFAGEIRLLLMVGLCGGFTTFSTFINESYQMVKEENFLFLFSYASLSFLGGLFMLYIGYHLIKILL